MEVVSPMSPMNLNFNSTSATCKHMGDYNFSAPTTRLLISVKHQLNTSPATVPFAWEEKPGVPKSSYKFLEQDFAFDLSGQFSSTSVPAEDLFDGGVIKPLEIRRVRERGSSFSFSGLPSSRNTRRTRSFSLHETWACPWEEEEEEEKERGKQQSPAAMKAKPDLVSSSSTLSASSKESRKWRFRDLFLFRSASDGRAMMDRDPLKKYSAIFRKQDEVSGSMRRGRASAHELHYMVNRAVSNDMKKKTFLPYKQGIMGTLAINPTVHALSNGFGFSHKN